MESTQNKKRNKVLIIGAKGMLGQELVAIYKKDKDYEIVAWDKEEADITDKKEIDKKIMQKNEKKITPIKT